MEELVYNYLNELDIALEKLSEKTEAKLVNLPSWVLCSRLISIAHISTNNSYVIKIIPEKSMEKDIIESTQIADQHSFNKFVQPFPIAHNINDPSEICFIIADMTVTPVEENSITNMPIVSNNGFIGIVSAELMYKQFSIQEAKIDALSFWNNACNNLDKNKSFLHNLTDIFNTFEKIIKRKAFLERRIHRYINEYRKYLLPDFKNCYFELPLFLNEEKRVADFVLERDSLFPPLLIELENPCHKILTKQGDFTKEVNHARRQISDWVKFINEDSVNTSGESCFLKGKKDRLIIIGKGFGYINKISQHDDITIWSYDTMIKEAKCRWNNVIKDQCRIIGLNEPDILL